MSQFRFYDTPTGLKVTVVQYDEATDNFYETTLADNLDRTKIHHFTFSLDLVGGPDNDILTTNFDGCRTTRIGSWEQYHRSVTPGAPTHTVDSLLIRASGTAAPALAGDGFYFDNVVTTTGPTPPAPPAPGVPSAPTGVSATTAGTGVNVSFTAPVVNACAPVTSYTITATPAGGGTPIVITSPTPGSTMEGLTPGVTYTITVVATNSFGDGAASAPLTYVASAAVTPTPTPSPSNPNGNLPDTGANNLGGLAAGGLGLIVAGAGALWYSRNRGHSTH
jgi:LPXTG-motif cell wall-anchored protein